MLKGQTEGADRDGSFLLLSSFSVSIINKNKVEISKEKSLDVFLYLRIKMIDNL